MTRLASVKCVHDRSYMLKIKRCVFVYCLGNQLHLRNDDDYTSPHQFDADEGLSFKNYGCFSIPISS